MTPELKSKLAKVYSLAKAGTDGEKAAAQAALDRLLAKHNLEGINLESLEREWYSFKWSSKMEGALLVRIVKMFTEDADALNSLHATSRQSREAYVSLRYIDNVTVSCAYEYFKRHMKAQYRKIVLPQIKRCRTAKAAKKKREELNEMFYSAYLIKSCLVKDSELVLLDTSLMSQKELKARYQLKMTVEGGSYSTQVQTGNLLN